MVKNKNNSKLPKLSPLILAGAFALTAIMTPQTRITAQSLDEKIRVLEEQREQARGASYQLGQQASGIQSEIDSLATQIAALQAQIDINTARETELNQQIDAAQQKLEEQKELLAANLRSMYIESDISPLEMIASSKNLSDFVDKQEYRNRIKEGVSSTMDEIERLKKQLNDQKKEVVKILDEQKSLRGNLDQKNAEATAVLAGVNQSKAAFDDKIKGQSREIASLRAQQRAANLAAGGGAVVASGSGGGGYPYNNVSYPCWSGGGCVDPWGLYKRECVSYTAFKVQQAGKYMPYFGGRGNANQWPSTARSFGIATGSTPRAESVAISMAGPYGHAMWVEAVLPDGRIHVSEYNYYVNGTYTERIISPSGLTFIYF